MTPTARTRVAIIGAGPAGLLLSHLLHRDGIPSIVIDGRSRDEIETTVRAGILENGSVDLLVETGASERVLRDGRRHTGIELQFDGAGHRIDFDRLVGRAAYLYPQHEVLIDLLARRFADDGDIRLEHVAIAVHDARTDEPRIVGTDASGSPFEIIADIVVGADGSRGVTRTAVNGSSSRGSFREYPFAWFGILCQAPPSSDELVYANSREGFALISQRSPTMQRMYLQCDPEQDPHAWSDAQIWDALQTRVSGRDLVEGPIVQRDVLRFRSFVAHSLRAGRVFLVGDAAHTVPPTGAKGMNLAINDVRILHEGLVEFLERGIADGIDHFEERALQRVWRAQHFSWWMTSMLHTAPDASDFDRRRQLGELDSLVASDAGMAYLAEAYTGWPAA